MHGWRSPNATPTPPSPRVCRALDRVARVTDRYDLAPLREAVAADNGPGEDEVPRETQRRAIAADHDFRATFGRTWPVLEPSW